MSKYKLEPGRTDLRIRPSSIDSFLGCSYQWALVFLMGHTSVPGSRAAIGTGIHAGAEKLWEDAMAKQDKEAIYVPGAIDAAVERFKEEEKLGLHYDAGEDRNTAINEVIVGTQTFASDIVPFTEIPDAVETRVTVEISGHPIVKDISGTIDYYGHGIIGDIKTSKRKATPENYEIQQSLYKHLAEANGMVVRYNLIQNIVLTKNPNGQVLELAPNVPKAKTVVNNLLDTLEVFAEDKVRPEVLFRGNPKYYLCSDKYCAFYRDCMFVKGEDPNRKQVHQVPVQL